MIIARAALFMILILGCGYLASEALLRGARSRLGVSHPSWMHAPAIGLFSGVVALGVLLTATGSPGLIAYVDSVNQYPTIGHFLSYFVPIGTLVIGLSVLVDELWFRQEIGKTFNWMSLIDEATIGLMLMVAYGREYHFYQQTGGIVGHTVTISWTLAMFVAAVLAAATVLELFRRPSPRQEARLAEDTSALETELARRTTSGEKISYFEGQNPAFLTVLVVVACAVSLVGAVISWRASMPWVSLLLLVIAGTAMLAYGGTRVTVTSTLLDVRLGMLGIRLLLLPTAEVNDVSVYMGGEASETNAKGECDIRSLSLGGRRGVMVRTTGGQRYLIGSDRPERLAAVLRAVTAKG